jgi:hypothetical protein
MIVIEQAPVTPEEAEATAHLVALAQYADTQRDEWLDRFPKIPDFTAVREMIEAGHQVTIHKNGLGTISAICNPAEHGLAETLHPDAAAMLDEDGDMVADAATVETAMTRLAYKLNRGR